jgi:hypothetical protein
MVGVVLPAWRGGDLGSHRKPAGQPTGHRGLALKARLPPKLIYVNLCKKRAKRYLNLHVGYRHLPPGGIFEPPQERYENV